MTLSKILAPLLICLLASGAALAQTAPSWHVQNRLQGKTKNGKIEKAEDVSGIACMPGPDPRLCLVVDDETQGAQVAIIDKGLLIAGDFIGLIDDTYQGNPLELDAESVAYADGFFYVAGSQGRARHEKDATKQARNNARAAAAAKIFRIKLAADTVDLATGRLKATPAITASSNLATLLQHNPVLAPSFDQPLQENGITVEGIAVRGANLYAAMRGPVLENGDAVIAGMPLAAIFDGKPGAVTVDRLALGKDTLGQPRGIRDLTLDGDRFLLIAGPENDPPKSHATALADFTLYAWDGHAVTRLLDLKPYGSKAKPEALTVLGADATTLHALLLFDGAKEGTPTPIDIPLH